MDESIYFLFPKFAAVSSTFAIIGLGF